MCENGKIYLNLSIFTVILKKRIIFFSKIRRSKVTDYAALKNHRFCSQSDGRPRFK